MTNSWHHLFHPPSPMQYSHQKARNSRQRALHSASWFQFWTFQEGARLEYSAHFSISSGFHWILSTLTDLWERWLRLLTGNLEDTSMVSSIGSSSLIGWCLRSISLFSGCRLGFSFPNTLLLLICLRRRSRLICRWSYLLIFVCVLQSFELCVCCHCLRWLLRDFKPSLDLNASLHC